MAGEWGGSPHLFSVFLSTSDLSAFQPIVQVTILFCSNYIPGRWAVLPPSVMLRFREVKQLHKVTQAWLEPDTEPRFVCVKSLLFPQDHTVSKCNGFTTQQISKGFLVPDLLFSLFGAFFQWLLNRFIYDSSFPVPLNVKNKTLFHSWPSFSPL